MNVIVLGAAGFIGTNLAIKLRESTQDHITLVDANKAFFEPLRSFHFSNVTFMESGFDTGTDFEKILAGQQVVYHLVSTTIPSNSNQAIAQELTANVVATAKMLDACVSCGVKKVVFISSGGTVYGKNDQCPIKEETETNPITSYGIQKVTIEKLLYLYRYMHGLEYRIVRLANPYGPYQRPNGMLGAVTTFTYKALKDEEIIVYGDGSVVCDYIYIDDAIRAIITIANGQSDHRTFNIGSGTGTSIKQVLEIIEKTLGKRLFVTYKPGRKVDVPVNYLNISRYEREYGELLPMPLDEGIRNTIAFMCKEYS